MAFRRARCGTFAASAMCVPYARKAASSCMQAVPPWFDAGAIPRALQVEVADKVPWHLDTGSVDSIWSAGDGQAQRFSGIVSMILN
mmetsp:Transcript_157392/g.501688  ORF Transcript_157392/g.501688 Transcript_157392/m.501688 type:complete len:86 (-) Transcript_157392:989-1246(-)